MLDPGVARDTLVSYGGKYASTLILLAATGSFIWYCVVCTVCAVGFVQTLRSYRKPPPIVQWGADAPHVTIIRPIKGVEPCLYECLACTVRQKYPREKVHIRFCIADRSEPSLPTLERLVQDFPDIDVQILIEAEDAVLQDGTLNLGPNPKIRNMSRAYRETVGDVVWFLDCNVWVAKGVLGRMVARLEGKGTNRKYKFVHHLPLVVDVEPEAIQSQARQLMQSGNLDSDRTDTDGQDISLSLPNARQQRSFWNTGGGRVEEMFLSTAHGKFYVAANSLLIINASNGKSNMVRRSHLDSLTSGQGVDYFSSNICEDYLLGNLLFKNQIPAEKAGEVWGRHALCWGDVALQPMTSMSVKGYWNRRIRWNRARMFAVPIATFVEPATESLLCSVHGAFAITTLPFFGTYLGIPKTWTAFALVWLLSVSIWCLADRIMYLRLNSASYVEMDEDTPEFARLLRGDGMLRPFWQWLRAWVVRELIASPVETWALWGGSQIEWRGRKFRVSTDMKVHEVLDATTEYARGLNGHTKARSD
ncbi:glycosyltransferase family 21 protein [Baudoinia panamericana UAMH 10762]|uniref:Ceramide glucosyltransferase n=1 Tax=Baudoinia panamericana (strain UAMH 10762) TaxID=717646 RepID=M2MRQ0_BAUPA|nr:glycosyltransferase family 21 protein [Baudoinia panamericana UAMH 10762]EMC94163.1 glycosyltransferase family 21 protein [Baudoinia panamericana UAMH 10762]